MPNQPGEPWTRDLDLIAGPLWEEPSRQLDFPRKGPALPLGLYVLNWPIQVIERIYLQLILLSSSNRKYQHFPLSSLCRRIWRYWYSKMLCQVHSVECVSKIKSIPSVSFHAILGAVCIQLTHLSYDDCENTCTLSYYHHQIWRPICHSLALGHGTMVCAVCISIFAWRHNGIPPAKRSPGKCWRWPTQRSTHSNSYLRGS